MQDPVLGRVEKLPGPLRRAVYNSSSSVGPHFVPHNYTSYFALYL